MNEMTSPGWESAILDYFNQPNATPLKQHDLALALAVPEDARNEFRQALHNLEQSGALVCLRQNRYSLSETESFFRATLLVFPQGFAVAQPDDASFGEIRIDRDAIGPGRNRDKVLVSVDRRHAENRRRKGAQYSVEGRVTRVLERHTMRMVGVLRRTSRGWRVAPDDNRQLNDIRVTGFGEGIRPEQGRKVVVELAERDHAAWEETGAVVEDLGDANDPSVDMIAIMRAHGLDTTFPEEVMAELESVSPTLRPEDHEGRRDLRAWNCFTIDPEDAKDHDDACSLRRLPNGNWELGVHIADVSHFVRPGTALDREAFRRATSCYLADRVVPMLPNLLTTDLCSLIEGHDRLAHSVLIEYTPAGKRLGFDTFPSVIHCRTGLHYEQVQAFFDDGRADGIPEETREVLTQMRKLARHLRQHRMREGAVGFDVPEIRVKLDNQGVPVRIVRREPMEAYQLIEDFMLAANMAVAEFTKTRERHATMYRVHEPPLEKQWRKMETDLLTLGLRATLNSSQDINRFVSSEQVPPYLRAAASVVILRNLKRAHYEAKNRGHFGLAFENYTHFTSPIRRYPDLVVHRVLKSIEAGHKPLYTESEMQGMARHCSDREQNAEEAERYSQELKKLQYYHNLMYKGETGPYPAVITGFVPRGILVELVESAQRGLVPFHTLTEEWNLDITGTKARARRSGAVMKIGDNLDVMLAKVDLHMRRIDFMPAPKAKAMRGAREESAPLSGARGPVIPGATGPVARAEPSSAAVAQPHARGEDGAPRHRDGGKSGARQRSEPRSQSGGKPGKKQGGKHGASGKSGSGKSQAAPVKAKTGGGGNANSGGHSSANGGGQAGGKRRHRKGRRG